MIKYENQNNYKNVPYPSQSNLAATIASGGCGCVSSVNVLRFFGININVADLATLFVRFGLRINGGTDMNAASRYLRDNYGLTLLMTTDENMLKEKLLEGCIAIANSDGDEGAKGIFSSSGHFITIIGYNNKSPKPFICFDPGYYNGKFTDSYRSKYVTVSTDIFGNTIQFTSSEALNIDTSNRNPQYWIFSKQISKDNPKNNIEEVINVPDYLVRKYQYCDENIPDGLQKELQEAINLGIVNYGGNGFDPLLSDQDVRTLVWIKRSISK